eukprot:RCo054075
MVRVVVCGLGCECSTFSPVLQSRVEFCERRGDALRDALPHIVRDPELQEVDFHWGFSAGLASLCFVKYSFHRCGAGAPPRFSKCQVAVAIFLNGRPLALPPA